MGHTNKVSDLQSHTGVEVMRCYQCGKCTAGCVLASEMNYPPSYLMRLLQTGTKPNLDKVLSSNSIWLCLNCENCLGRCPMEIDIPKMMDYLGRKQSKKINCILIPNPLLPFISLFLIRSKTPVDCMKWDWYSPINSGHSISFRIFPLHLQCT